MIPSLTLKQTKNPCKPCCIRLAGVFQNSAIPVALYKYPVTDILVNDIIIEIFVMCPK